MNDKVIGVFSPANPMTKINPRLVNFGINHLESLGFKIKFSKNAHAETGYTAGSVSERVDDIHQLFEDPDVSLLMSTYGGYNSNQLLDRLDYELIKQHPKPIIGYSDTTALLNGIYAKTNVQMLHGPSFVSFTNPTILNPFTSSFLDMINNKKNIRLVSSQHCASDEWYLKKDFKPREIHAHSGWSILKPADISGILVGGSLETFLALIGTAYLPSCNDKILLLESTENNPAKFDRDITQLRHTGILDEIKGLIVGQFPTSSTLHNKKLVEEIILANTPAQDYPILLNTNFSHVDPHYTIPIGGEITIGCKPEPYLIIKN